MRVEIIRPAELQDAGRSVLLDMGDEMDLAEPVARGLIAGGYAREAAVLEREIIEGEPQVGWRTKKPGKIRRKAA